ncbi:DUF1642 domain-containing protein [Streptococcus ruminantium]|uniref:DUF1642 domain-containing protein n=1 Tax=Streptococcus ruminantium TaxID=1917441 RepID=UPI001F2318ED|nr:DUF1642 domain-containing protein [Streptococcus ruminantium]BDD42655.1 hypothetical protein GUT189_09880 [Streptococcus ruminantium]
MNKQEALKLVEQMGEHEHFVDEPVSKKSVLNIIYQIDQPQKVVVPKFVAEWIEECKSIPLSLDLAFNSPRIPDDVAGWLIKFKNQEIFARAWLDGYEIEREKLYTVEIPNNGGFIVLAYINHAMKLVDGNKHLPGKFTKESIEYAGFGWVFDCEGVTVEEVQ